MYVFTLLSSQPLTLESFSLHCKDYPLSYVVEDENGELIGKGVAFRILEFLREKFNFTVKINLARENIIGSKDDYNGSVVEALANSVKCAAQTVDSVASFRFHFRRKRNWP